MFSGEAPDHNGVPSDVDIVPGRNRKRILQICPLYVPGVNGAVLYVQSLCEGFAKRGHKVEVWAPRSADFRSHLTGITRWSLPREQVCGGVNVRRFAFSPATARLLRTCETKRLLKAVFRRGFRADPWAVTKHVPMPGLCASLLTARHDVVVVSDAHTTLFMYCRFAKRFNRKPLVFIPLLHTLLMSDNHPLAVWALDADAIICMTEHERKWFVDRGVPGERVFVTGVGIDPNNYKPGEGDKVRQMYGMGDAPVVGYVGRLSPKKGIESLVMAMPHVWKREPRARLLLAGARSSHTAILEDMVQALPWEHRQKCVMIINFPHGMKSRILSTCDVVAMPSIADSFGTTYLEAWLHKRPVIGCDKGAPAELIQEGVDGLQVAYEEPEVLAARIAELFQNPDLRHSMGQSGRRKVLARFTTDRILEQTEAIYMHTLDRCRTRRRLRASVVVQADV